MLNVWFDDGGCYFELEWCAQSFDGMNKENVGKYSHISAAILAFTVYISNWKSFTIQKNIVRPRK